MKKEQRLKIIAMLFGMLVSVVAPVLSYAGTIELPKTGQTTSYATRDDGDLETGVAWPNPRFTDIGDGTVKDELTGLVWTKNANLPNGTKTWQQALDYVAGMNAGTYPNYGYTDWRLPNVNELSSLMDHSGYNPALPSGHPFTNVQSNYYWSSTTNQSSTGNAWVIDMYDCYVDYYDKSYGISYAWPVRSGQGGLFDNLVICLPKTGQTTSYYAGDDGDLEIGVAWPNPRFTDIGDGTVKDELTGLVWTKNANLLNGDKTWQQALDYVVGMNAGTYPNFGYTDWRLPNVNELKSLIDNSEYGPALPSGHPFTNLRYAFWSSTTDSGYTDGAWVVSIGSGYVFSIDKSGYDGSYAWPVRGPGESHMVIEPAGTHDFGEVPLGSSASTTVAIRNTGTAPLVINKMYEFEFPCYSDNAPSSGYVISPGQSLEIVITFTPAYVGDGGYDCLNFMTSNGHGSICVNGTGVPPATICLPKTGQTTSYATKDDGDLETGVAWPIPRFTDFGDGMVNDKLTGLVWTKNANLPNSPVTWQQALDYVAGMNVGTYPNFGYTDWRLPNVNELKSLIDHSEYGPALPSGHPFTNVQTYKNYWSSTTRPNFSESAFVVSMDIGYLYNSDKSSYSYFGYSYYAWPVRAGQGGLYDNSVICLPKTGQTVSYASGDDGDLEMGVAWSTPRFTDNLDGTVNDKLTGLAWTKNANLPNGTKTWQQALDYVAGMNAGTYPNFGYTDWRLPNVNELKSLIDHSRYNPALPSDHPFTNVQTLNDHYWSSTTYALFTDMAWDVLMSIGWVEFSTKSSNNFYVWPVRGPGERQMVIEPAGTHDFGEVPQGSSASTIVAIRNTGTAPLVINEMYEFEFPCYSDNAPPSGYVISPGQSLEIVITFTPAYVGDGGYDCLNFMTSDGYGSICVSGTGSPPATVIALASFTADPGKGSVKLLWKTETETDNAGFNIYRAEAAEGKYVKLNSSLIPAKGSAAQGATYEFVDRDVQNRKTYYYKLEDMDLSGKGTMHGPVSATPRLLFGYRD